MNRRDALKALAAVPLVGTVQEAASRPTPRTELLPLTLVGVDETPHLIGKIKVLLNGVEMRWCKRANSAEGWVDHFVCDESGKRKPLFTPDGTARTYGRVEIVPCP